MEPQPPPPLQDPNDTNNNPAPVVVGPSVSPSLPTEQPSFQSYTTAPTQPVVGSQLGVKTNKSKRWLLFAIVLVIVVLIVGGGFYYFENKSSNHPAQANESSVVSTEGGVPFNLQSYTNKGNSYKLMFYDGSTSKQDPQISTDGTTFIIGPSNANKGFPLELMIGKANDSATLQAYLNNKNCPSPSTIAFTVHIDSAATDANVCSVALHGKIVTDLMSYESDGFVYITTIGQYYDHQKGVTNKQYAQDIVNNVDLAQYESDIKTILASIQPST